MAQGALARELGVLHFADQLGLAPMRGRVDARRNGERRCLDLALLERREQLFEHPLVEAGADVSNRHELPVLVDTEEERTERVASATLPLGPSADDAVHRPEGLDLHPRRGAGRRVRRIETLGDDPLDPLLLRRFEERDPRADELLGQPDGAHRRQHLVEQLLALAQRLPRHVLAIDPEDVEHLVHDRRALAELAHRRLVPHVHAGLQLLEARRSALVERDDLAVEDRLVGAGQRL